MVNKSIRDIKQADDNYSNKSKEWLRERLYQDIKSVFVGALRTIETHLGKGFPAFDSIRSEILGIGNDAVRDMHSAVDSVNVEYIPEVMEFGNNKAKGKE